jgi:hypothetical protein
MMGQGGEPIMKMEGILCNVMEGSVGRGRGGVSFPM